MNVQSARIWTIAIGAMVVVPVLLFGRHPADTREAALPSDGTAGRLTLRKASPLEIPPAANGRRAASQLPRHAPAGEAVAPSPRSRFARGPEGVPSAGTPGTRPPRDLRLPPHTNVSPDPVGQRAADAPGALHRHRVVDGETLASIAQEHLGDANRWEELFRENRHQLERADILPLGVELLIPPRVAPAMAAAERAGGRSEELAEMPRERGPSPPRPGWPVPDAAGARSRADGRETPVLRSGRNARWVPVPPPRAETAPAGGTEDN